MQIICCERGKFEEFLPAIALCPRKELKRKMKNYCPTYIVWILVITLLAFNNLLWSQNGPYPIFEFPKNNNWSVFDSIQSNQNIPATYIWQPNMTVPVQGVVVSESGLVLLPTSVLDSSLLKKATWLNDSPNGQVLPLNGTKELALLTTMEDITNEVLVGIPDTISPDARAIKIANALLKYKRRTTTFSKTEYVRPFYQGNRFCRFVWQPIQARLLGQVFAPNGQSFLIARLQSFSDKEKLTFPYLPIYSDEQKTVEHLFIGGLQSFPKEVPPPAKINLYYTQLLPLFNEAQILLTTHWKKSTKPPAWLSKLDASYELEMPLHPFADPAQAIKEAQNQEASLLQSLKENRDDWWKYQQIQENIQSGYEELAPLLIAKTLAQEIIPTRLQLFRLVRFLLQWEKTVATNPEMLKKRAASLSTFLAHFYASFDSTTDQLIAEQFLDLYLERTRYDLQSPFVIEQWVQAEKKTKIMATALYQKSDLTDGEAVQKAFMEDPAAFFQQLSYDYAYQFVQKWETEHRDRISKQLNTREKILREEERKMIEGLLQYAPSKAAVEKGGLSFTAIPFGSDQHFSQISPHLLGNYPEGSPVLSPQGHLMGITYYDGDHPLFTSQTSNRVLDINFLQDLKRKYPNHPVTRELFLKR